MNPIVLDLIIKGIESLPALVDAGINIYHRVQQIRALAQGAKDGTLTPADIAKIRAEFDANLADFNTPMT
jgi:flagellin-like hook-associated protein FlgL